MSSVIDLKELELPLDVLSEDGKEYVVDIWTPKIQDLESLWEQYNKYPLLFSDTNLGNKLYLFGILLHPNTLVLSIKHDSVPVGIAYADNIRPKGSANAHYFFWDKKTSGRQRVILTALDWAMRQMELHRMNIVVPMFAYSALHRIYKMGFRLEGRMRENFLSRGKWIDALLFGVLHHELTPEAIESGRVSRTPFEQEWFDLLKNDDALAQHIVNRRERNGD